MDLLDILGGGDGLGDLISSGAEAATDFGGQSAADYFAQLVGQGDDIYGAVGGGFYGADDDTISQLMGLDTGEAISALQNSAGNGGITGISAIDKVLKNLGERWEKDPLSMIGTGIGILGKIDAYKKAKAAAKGGGGGFGGMPVMPARAEDPYRAANVVSDTPRVAPQPAGALSRVVPAQIPIFKG